MYCHKMLNHCPDSQFVFVVVVVAVTAVVVADHLKLVSVQQN